jgi:tRNA uridine 5-carboxymethylaminomethyl modification enzyme
VVDNLGIEYHAPALVITAGTFLNGRLWVGRKSMGGGRPGEAAATGITAQLAELGVTTGRLKTGTPPRLDGRTIDYSGLEVQPGDADPYFFSFLPERPRLAQMVCHITRTNEQTHEIIRQNLHESPMYSGLMDAECGPRYCPSIEDKVMRFADKDSHHLFVEPEGRNTYEVYLQGFSTCLPYEVQQRMIRSLPGLEHAEMLRPACAVEYDYFPAYQCDPSLMLKRIPGLFHAGQVNGTSGYEEAAAQGLVAGINAARYVGQQEPLILPRASSYIGTLIDDLVTKEILEPYRMLTSRSEYRLLLRQDNADARLTPIGREIRLVDDVRWQVFQDKQAAVAVERERLVQTKVEPSEANNALLAELAEGEHIQEKMSLLTLLKRPTVNYGVLTALDPASSAVPRDIAEFIETELKYEGYLVRQQRSIQQMEKHHALRLPADIDYHGIGQLSKEAREKLDRLRPVNLGQAARINGVTPADISILQVLLTSRKLAAQQAG